VIQNNVMAAAPAGSPAKAAAPGTRKLFIRKLALTNGRVAASIGGQSLRLGISDIRLTDIGKETGGATPDQVASAVFAALTRSATGAVTHQAGQAGGAVSKAEESLRKLFK
jgi:hypothetical protein